MASSKHVRNGVYGALLLGVSLCPASLRAQAPAAGGTDRSALLSRAEATMQRALVLRKMQTNRNLALSGALFQKSAGLFETAHAPKEAADAYLEAGEIDVMFSRYVMARRWYRAALKIGPDEARCKALSRTARTYSSTGRLDVAERISMEAMSLCETIGGTARAEGLVARGEALRSAGQQAKSAEYLEQAEELFARGNDVGGRAQSLLMLAFALYADGRQEKALQAAAEALRLWSSLEDLYGVARARAALGIFAIIRGEFETAQCNYKIAKPILQAIGNKDEEASVLNGMGYASRETGDWQKSFEYYQSAQGAFSAVQDLLGEHEAITGMGKALLSMKRYRQLLSLSETELRLARRSGDSALIASSFGDMAAVYEAQGRYAASEAAYRRAFETYRGANHLYGEGDILIRLGRLQARRGKYSEALALLEQAKALKEKTEQIEEIAKIQYEMARIYRQLNRLDDARSAIEKTIEIVEMQRVTIAQFDSRASYFASVHRYYTLYVDVLMRLSGPDPSGNFAKKAFEASEKSKVRSLIDLLTTSAQDAPCGELLEKQLLATSATEARPTEAQKEGRPATTLALAEVQAEIEDAETLLLEYSLGDDSSYVWAVGRNQVASYELPESGRLRKLVAILRETLVPPELRSGESASDYQARVRTMDRSYQTHARELAALLLGPVDLGQAKRLLIVPDGSLQYLPFAALPLPGSGPNQQFLLDHFEIDVLPSASVLGTLRRGMARRTPPTATMAVFGDPVFEQNDPRVSPNRMREGGPVQERPHSLSRAIRDTGGAQYIPRLPASRDEAKAIAAMFRSGHPSDVYIALDFNASRDYVVKGGLADFRLIHFATHGVVDAHRPEMSGLILSLIDERGRKQDGYLRIGDIYKLSLAADLITLSSCDSALGKDMDSEGIIGLPRAFLYAGAKGVIASLWKVDDEATARMMSALYARIKNGESPGSALRRAQLELAHDERWSKPYYWAAFVLQGDYR
jgi:CHAT domain-containing protein/tetratricopeptide (TPR) repeat protein